MSYDEVRIERDDSIISYLAPETEILHQDSNNLTNEGMPNDNPAFIYNRNEVMGEVTVQGTFEHYENYPQDYQAALIDLYSSTPITAIDQVNRLRGMTLYSSNTELLELYTKDIQYTAKSDNDLDPVNGIYPAVAITEMRFTDTSGNTKISFMIKFSSGID